MEGAFAATALAALGAGMGIAGAADNANKWHEHGLCSWGTGVTYRCPRTQVLSFKPPSTYVAFSPKTWWGSARSVPMGDQQPGCGELVVRAGIAERRFAAFIAAIHIGASRQKCCNPGNIPLDNFA